MYENTVNKKVYVGQTAMRLEERWWKHRSDSRFCKTRFARAIKKYTPEAFNLIFRYDLESRDDANVAERFLVSLFNSTVHAFGYNIQRGGTTFGGHSEETRRKMSLAHMGNPSRTGHKISAETSAKLSAIGKGRPHTKEHALKISIALKGRKPSSQCVAGRIAYFKQKRDSNPRHFL